MLSREETDVLLEGLTDIQETAQAALKNLKKNMRISENEKASPHTQMQEVMKEKNSFEKIRTEASAMLEKVYSISDICKLIIEEEHTFNKDFLDFLDKIGQRHQFPLQRYAEKLLKRFDKERKLRMMKWFVQMSIPDCRNKVKERILDDVITKPLRQ